MMDAVDDKVIERIEEKAYNAVMSLFRRPIRVIFYDATTVA
jgi:hypothetical protein